MIYAAVEYDKNGNIKNVYEGQMIRGEYHGLNRQFDVDKQQTTLKWYYRGNLNGKYMIKQWNNNKCFKLKYSNGI